MYTYVYIYMYILAYIYIYISSCIEAPIKIRTLMRRVVLHNAIIFY